MHHDYSRYLQTLIEEHFPPSHYQVPLWENSKAELHLQRYVAQQVGSDIPSEPKTSEEGSKLQVQPLSSEQPKSTFKQKKPAKGEKRRGRQTSSALASLRNHYNLNPQQPTQPAEPPVPPAKPHPDELPEGDAERLTAIYAQSVPQADRRSSDSHWPVAADDLLWSGNQTEEALPGPAPTSQQSSDFQLPPPPLPGPPRREEPSNFPSSLTPKTPRSASQSEESASANDAWPQLSLDPFDQQQTIELMPVLPASPLINGQDHMPVMNPGEEDDEWQDFEEHHDAEDSDHDYKMRLPAGFGEEDEFKFLPDLSYLLSASLQNAPS